MVWLVRKGPQAEVSLFITVDVILTHTCMGFVFCLVYRVPSLCRFHGPFVEGGRKLRQFTVHLGHLDIIQKENQLTPAKQAKTLPLIQQRTKDLSISNFSVDNDPK